MSRRVVTAAVVVMAVGVLGVALVSASVSMSMRDTVELAAVGAVAAIVASALGAVGLRLVRSRSIGAQAAVIAITSVFAVAAGVALAAEMMFVSTHDFGVLSVVLVAVAAVAVIGAIALGARIDSARERLVAMMRSIEGPAAPDRSPAKPGDDSAVALGPSDFSELEVELRSARRRLDEAAQRERVLESSRRELIAWVSHDLRTPITGIRAMVEALEDGVVADAETVQAYYARMRVEADGLSRLVDDLLELSRTHAGTLRLSWQRMELTQLVSDVLASSTPVARAKGVRLHSRVDHDVPEVIVSPPEVLRALRNLIENAIRHTPSDGSVFVEAGVVPREPSAPGPSRVFVTISDTGGGVPEEHLDAIFDVGFQVDRARTPGGGAGLGLAIAKGLVDAHHGDISVCNDDRGARFTIELPVEQPA